MVELNVKFIKRLYGTEDSNFSIFAAEPASGDDLRHVSLNDYGNFTISGDFFLEDSELGNSYKVSIEEDRSAKYPNSYKLIKLHYSLPTNAADQWDYVQNGRVIPLGKLIAIRKELGRSAKILDIILHDHKKLTKVEGVSQADAQEYHNEILDSNNKALLFAEYGDIEGVGPATIKSLQLFNSSAEKTISLIKENPFIVIKLSGIGFLTADKFRAYYGLPLNSQERILHGANYYLQGECQSTGNTYENILEAAKMIAIKLGVGYKEVIMSNRIMIMGSLN